MTGFYKIVPFVFVGVLTGQTGCTSSREITNTTAASQTEKMDSAQKETLTVQIDGGGKAHDKNGVEMTHREVSERLADGRLKRTTAVIILVRGTQKDGVLETAQMFASLGFKSVLIHLVVEDPLK